MRMLHLTQRTDEWNEFRKTGVGASESAAILGSSPYKNAKDIWEEKTGRAFPEKTNMFVEQGIKLEEEARHAFQGKIENMFIPCVAQHDEHDMIFASFDGMTLDEKEFVELKCPQKSLLFEVIKKNNEEILIKSFPYYWVQVQHQFAVCNTAEKGYLAAYKNGEIAYMEIKRNNKFINETLIPGILNFWNEYVLKDKEPEIEDNRYIYIDDENSRVLAEEWKFINQQLKALESKEKELRAALCDLGDDSNFIVSNILKVTRVEGGKGRVNTKKLYESYNISEEDLDKFRGEQIGFYRITIINE